MFFKLFFITGEQERLQEIVMEFCKTFKIVSDNKL